MWRLSVLRVGLFHIKRKYRAIPGAMWCGAEDSSQGRTICVKCVFGGFFVDSTYECARVRKNGSVFWLSIYTSRIYFVYIFFRKSEDLATVRL